MYVHTELSFRYKLSVQHLYSMIIFDTQSHLHLRGRKCHFRLDAGGGGQMDTANTATTTANMVERGY